MNTYNVELYFDGKHIVEVKAKSLKEAKELVGEGQYDNSQIIDESENFEIGYANKV